MFWVCKSEIHFPVVKQAMTVLHGVFCVDPQKLRKLQEEQSAITCIF